MLSLYNKVLCVISISDEWDLHLCRNKWELALVILFQNPESFVICLLFSCRDKVTATIYLDVKTGPTHLSHEDNKTTHSNSEVMTSVWELIFSIALANLQYFYIVFAEYIDGK